MCFQYFIPEKNTSIRKYIRRKGHYAGMRNIVKNVQNIAIVMDAVTFFQRLNSVMLRNAGLSIFYIVYGISTF
jgi:hypothetical protein